MDKKAQNWPTFWCLKPKKIENVPFRKRSLPDTFERNPKQQKVSNEQEDIFEKLQCPTLVRYCNIT
jgi:hypothetical protein